MMRAGRWLTALCLIWLVAAWVMPTAAQVPPGYEPEVRLLNPEGFGDGSSNSSGKSAAVDGSSGGQSAKTGGFGSWLADHGLGLVKGIGAGLIGAAVVVGVAALVVGAGAPLLLMAGAAVLGGALYGAFAGSKNFSWTEAIVGSVIGGVSAGVGSWLAGTGSALASRVGVAAVDMVGGGLASTASYLIHTPNPTLGGAAAAFGIGAGTAAAFMGAGAVVSKGWKWAKGALGLGNGVGKAAPQPGLVNAALSDPPDGVPAGQSLTTSSPDVELRTRVLQNINASRRAREASRFGEYAITEAQVGDIVKWRATHGYQYDVYTEGPLSGKSLHDPARNFAGMKYTEVVLPEDTVMYRGGVSDRPYGQWLTKTPPFSEANVRLDSAVKAVWVDPITQEHTGTSLVDTVFAIKIPKGTTVYVGPVGSQGGPYLGGESMMQVFVRSPWKIDGAEIVGQWRIVK